MGERLMRHFHQGSIAVTPFGRMKGLGRRNNGLRVFDLFSCSPKPPREIVVCVCERTSYGVSE